MDRRSLLLIAIPAAAATGLFGLRRLLSPKTDLDLLAGHADPIFPLEPLQEPGTREPLLIADAWLSPFARFSLSAVVLGARLYGPGDDAQASAFPVDLALGWGPMSAPRSIDEVKVTQGGRFYHWRVGEGGPIGPAEIMTSSANMHICAADPALRDRLIALRRGDFIRIEGWLTDAEIGGLRLRSSRHRRDSGPGACEIVLVERLLKGAAEIGAG